MEQEKRSVDTAVCYPVRCNVDDRLCIGFDTSDILRMLSNAEGVQNTEYHQGDACKLDFPDEYFDAVTSNYVYHNIAGANKQELLRETLRVLKKGGTFAIHDIMSKARYGDMQQFVRELYDEGYEVVELIDTTNDMFMSKGEAKVLGLSGSSLLIGKK